MQLQEQHYYFLNRSAVIPAAALVQLQCTAVRLCSCRALQLLCKGTVHVQYCCIQFTSKYRQWLCWLAKDLTRWILKGGRHSSQLQLEADEGTSHQQPRQPKPIDDHCQWTTHYSSTLTYDRCLRDNSV